MQEPAEALVVVLALKIPHHWIPKTSFLHLRKTFSGDSRNNKNVKDLSVDVARGRMDFFFLEKNKGAFLLIREVKVCIYRIFLKSIRGTTSVRGT